MSDISSLTDESIIAIAKQLNWKEAPAEKLRRTMKLNQKSEKVQAAIQEEVDRILNEEERKKLLEAAMCGVEELRESAEDEIAHFGTSVKATEEYIQQEFGLTPKMAKRAVMRGINRREYHGRGYVVKVVDTSDAYDIQVYAA